jgi:ATP-dependent Zn protease
MSERLGLIGFRNAEYHRPYSEDMGGKIDREIMEIIAQCTLRTKEMVKKYEHLIKKYSFCHLDCPTNSTRRKL